MKHILQLLDHTVRRWGSRPAFGDEHRTLTWNEVEDAVQRIGTALAGLRRTAPPGGDLP